MKNELKLFEQGNLIRIYETTDGKKVVDGRELWTGLEVKQKFADWIKNNLNSTDAIEGVDFTSFQFKEKAENTYITTVEYTLTLGIAKEICMITGAMPRANDSLKKKSKEYRKYFIEIEEKSKQNKQEIKEVQVMNDNLAPQVLSLAQGMQLIGQVVQGIQLSMSNIQTYVQDSIQSKDLQIEQTMDLIGLRARNKTMLINHLKQKLSDLTGRNITANNEIYNYAKNKVFREYKVTLWEDIPINKINSAFSYIDCLEKDDLRWC